MFERKQTSAVDATASFVEDKSLEGPSEESVPSSLPVQDDSLQVIPVNSQFRTMKMINIQQDRKLLRKIDLNLLPWLCLLYLASFLDRTNIGNAKIAGLQSDLNMTDSEWQASLAIFFVSYSIFEPLSNVLLKRIRPSIYIPTM